MAFRNDRAHRFTTVHTDCIDDEGKSCEAIRPNGDRTDECVTPDQVHRTPTHHTANTRLRSTPYWRESDSVAGHVSSKHAYWESEILQDHPSRDTLLGSVRGLRLTEFIDRSRKGTYQGHAYHGAVLTSIVELPNHNPQEFDAWVDKEVAALVGKGRIARWSKVADVSTHPKPKVTLQVGIEPTKLRFICDAQYLNLICEHSEFKMDGVGKVAQCSWQGAHQISMDHKSGFHNVPLHPDSWTYFGMYWKGVYYVWAVICFGWRESPYIYRTLSSAVAQYPRHLDVPITTWLDDLWMSNFQATKTQSPAQQREAAREIASLALTIFYQCDYFMSIAKCVLEATTRLVFLGIICDTEARRFEVLECKVAQVRGITHGRNHKWVDFFRRPRALGREVHKHARCRSTYQFVHVPNVQTHCEGPPHGG